MDFCLPNLYLIGVRKCGTTDILKWFKTHEQVAYSIGVSDLTYINLHLCEALSLLKIPLTQYAMREPQSFAVLVDKCYTSILHIMLFT